MCPSETRKDVCSSFIHNSPNLETIQRSNDRIVESLHSNRKIALARRLSWLEHHPVHQRVAGSIPSQGTYLRSGFGRDPLLTVRADAGGNQVMFLSHIDLCLFLSPSLSLQISDHVLG